MDKNDQVSHMKTLSDDVLRKIGRNVLLFQAIERLLKLLIANHRADGTTIDFVERREKRAEKIETQMMGKLIKQYGDAILSDAGEPRKETEEIRNRGCRSPSQALATATFACPNVPQFRADGA